MSSPPVEETVVLLASVGDVIDDRWRIDKRVGIGAMGTVFRGTDLTHDVPVAIKFLSPEHCRKPRVLARFEREAKLLTTIEHPNIVRFFGVGRRGALPYIVTEYLEGLTLGELLLFRGGRLPMGETLALLAQLKEGLGFMHEHGLVHRDIKPQNIIVDVTGHATLLDFGIARDKSDPGLTKPGTMVGTPYYMAPEQIGSHEQVDHRADVYAVAAMTFELLTGRPPFRGPTNFEVLHAHKFSPPPDASHFSSSVNARAAAVLIRSLDKKKARRHGSVAAFADALEGAAGEHPVPLRVPAPKAVAGRPRNAISQDIPLLASADVQLLPTRAKMKATQGPPTRKGPFEIPRPPSGKTRKRASHDDASQTLTDSSELRVIAILSGASVRATVTVDGKKVGTTPIALSVDPGMHRVKVSKPGCTTAQQRVEAKENFVTMVRLEIFAR